MDSNEKGNIKKLEETTEKPNSVPDPKPSAKKSLFSSSSLKTLRVFGAGFAFVSVGLITAGYFTRTNISQTAIESVLNSKGIESDINIEDIGINGAKFAHMRIGDKNNPTLVASGGDIKWHIDAKNGKIIIENFTANNIYANFTLNESGLDYGALKPLMAKSDGPSRAEIQNINLPNANINLSTPYGVIINHTNIKGSLDKGFNIFSGTFLPEKIDDTQSKVNIGIVTGPINGGDLYAGIATRFNGNDIKYNTEINNTDIANIRGKIIATFVSDTKKNNYLKIERTKLSADKVKTNGIDSTDFSLNVKTLNWHSANAWARDAVITFLGDINSGKMKYDKYSLGKSDLFVDLSRDKKGQVNINARLNGHNVNSDIKVNTVNINSISNFTIDDLTNFNLRNLSSNIALNGAGINGKEIDGLRKQLASAGLNIGDKLNLNTALLVRKNDDNISIHPSKAIEINDGKATRIIFKDARKGAHISGINLIKSDDKWVSGLIAKGDLLLESNIGKITSQINGLSFAENKLEAKLANTNAHNLIISDFTVNGAINSANIGVVGNKVSHADLIGNLIVKSDKYKTQPSNIKVLGKINNNDLSLKANGKLNGFVTDGFALGETNLAVNAYGNLSNITNIKGDMSMTAIESRVSDQYTLKKTEIITPFEITNNNGATAINAPELIVKSNALLSKDINSDSIKVTGPLNANVGGNNKLNVKSDACLGLNVKNLHSGEYYIPEAKGTFCPDKSSQLLVQNDKQTNLYGTTKIDGTTVMLGKGADAQQLKFASLRGSFRSNPNGAIVYDGVISDISLRLKMSENQYSYLKAVKANVSVNSANNNTGVKGSLFDISAIGMPVLLNGNANANLNISKSGGTNGTFNFNNIKIQDAEKQKKFADLTLDGSGNLKNNKIFVTGALEQTEKAVEVATFVLNHDLNGGNGNLDVNAIALEFTEAAKNGKPKFGVNDLVPSLRGVLISSSGVVNADARLEWASKQPLKSNATINSDSLNFLTPAAQFYGVAGNLVFDDLLSAKTAPNQQILVKLIEAGIPIENGVITFSLDGDNAINVIGAEWPLADGKLKLNPVKVKMDNSEKFLTVDVEDFDIAKLLLLTKVPNLEIEGRMDGKLPIHIIDNDLEIVSGVLRVNNEGGTLRYTGPDLGGGDTKDNSNQNKSFSDKIKEKFTGKKPPQGVDLAVSALRNLKYKVLEMQVNGRLASDVFFRLLVEGNNPELLSGQGFRFNIGINVPLQQLMKSYNSAFGFDENNLTVNDAGEYEYNPYKVEVPKPTEAPKTQ